MTSYKTIQNDELPYVTFYRVLDDAPVPQRADRAAGGTLPTRASRYCDPVTSASSFGWWIFPPMTFSVLWDGNDIFWSWNDHPDWQILESAQYPGFSRRFDAVAPPEMTGCSLPFLTALPEPGLLQIWTGLMARTAPAWSLLIRPLANLTNQGGFTMFEGIVETDNWFGSLFANLRITRSHQPVKFSSEFPLAQVQPLPRVAYSEQTLNSVKTIVGLEGFTDTDWMDYHKQIVVPNTIPNRAQGNYAIAARRRRRKAECPYSPRNNVCPGVKET